MGMRSSIEMFFEIGWASIIEDIMNMIKSQLAGTVLCAD
jgi:hypothetical protein